MPGQKYIILFKDSATDEEIQEYIDEINQNGGQVTSVYTGVIRGFAAVIPYYILSSLRESDIVQTIEPDRIITLDPIPGPTLSASF